MEPELRILFARVIKSMSLVLLWMLTNMTFGVYFDFGFIHASVSLGNIIFYIFMLATLAALVWYLLKIWKQDIPA